MSKRILVLDDDPALLDILNILLTDAGYEPVLIAQTDDLFGLVNIYQPSLIILDYLLNGRDGGEWCAKLKSHPDFRLIPVLIFTASNKVISKGSFGCDDFLAKPFDIDEILLRIQILIQHNCETHNPNSGLFSRSRKSIVSSNRYDHH